MNPHIIDVPAIDGKNTKNTLVELIPYKKNSKKSKKLQLFFTPVYSSTVFVLMVVVTLEVSVCWV